MYELMSMNTKLSKDKDLTVLGFTLTTGASFFVHFGFKSRWALLGVIAIEWFTQPFF